MSQKTTIAVIVGALLAASTYYVWCSWQWKKAAEAEAAAAPGASATGATPTPQPTGAVGTIATPQNPATPEQNAFVQAGVLTVDARLSNPYVLQNSAGTMHVALKATASNDTGVATRLPANLVLVIDRSGSMTGLRIQHAKAAAAFLLDQLQDGDRFALVTYSNEATVDVPSTLVNTDNKPSIRAAIERISVTGNTCISCGLTAGRQQLALASGQSMAHRLLLLSDGLTNRGITEPEALSQMATELQNQLQTTVSTVGVGLDYNEDVMSRLARNGNGSHYFVEDPSTLAATLQNELETLQNLVARTAQVSFTLAPGVRFVRGYDRSFEVVGDRVLVSLGAFPAGREKTVLMELGIPTQGAERVPVTSVSLTYENTNTRTAEKVEGELIAKLTADASLLSAHADKEVAARIHQSELLESMNRANELVRQGQFDEADRILEQQISTSAAANSDFGSERLQNQIKIIEKSKKKMKKQRSAGAAGRKRAAKSNSADLSMPAFD